MHLPDASLPAQKLLVCTSRQLDEGAAGGFGLSEQMSQVCSHCLCTHGLSHLPCSFNCWQKDTTLLVSKHVRGALGGVTYPQSPHVRVQDVAM